MIHYGSDNPSEIAADALVLEVDCAGSCIHDPSLLAVPSPSILSAYRQAFEQGLVEPGRLIEATWDAGAARVFLLPTRIHRNSQSDFLDAGLITLIDRLLAIGAKSVAFPKLKFNSEPNWHEAKLRLFAAFARVPDIQLHLFTPGRTEKSIKRITIFSDGAAVPNPGIGGYGVVLRFGENSKELSAGFRQTNSSRMELLGAIAGLEALKESCRVRLHSDSRYLIDYVRNGLLFRLAARNWKSEKAKDLDLWKRFMNAFLIHEVEMVWIKGHAGIADNERCDMLASQALRSSALADDEGFVFHKSKKKVSQTIAPGTKMSKEVLTPDGVVGPKPKQLGDLCRYCHKPLIQRTAKKHSPNANYWYEWYLFCESCRRMYQVDAAKVYRQ